MLRFTLRHRSLKSRVTFGTLAIFLISVWSLSIYVETGLRGDLQRQLSRQQFSTASFLAADADRTLKEHLHALGRMAGQLGQTLLTDPDTLKEHLGTRPVLLDTFNGGIIVLKGDGEGVGQNAGASAYRELDGVQTALREGKATIGGASVDPVAGTPVFAMSVPISDENANVIGALVGIVNLSARNFLDQITESYYGHSGYFLIVSEKGHRIVVGTGKRRIMDDFLAPDASPLIGRFAQGFDETGVTTDAHEEVLASARRIPFAGWYLVAAMPTSEAFALVREMQMNMLKAALFLTLLAGGLTWWMLRREFAPMLTAVRTLTELSTSDRTPSPLPVNRPDEIGQLIAGFNSLLETLAGRQEALRESESRFTAFMDTLPAAAFIEDRDGTLVYANRYTRETVGLGSWPGKVSAVAVEPGDTTTVVVTEEEIRDAANNTRLFQTHRFEIPYQGHPSLMGGIALDITERRRMEAQVRLQLLHDPLTGLPNRSLLNDRLEQAQAATRRLHSYGALLFMDLDNFKPLNDRHGHAAGDLLLIEAARRLKDSVREMDTVARFGGDEFVVIVGNLSPSPDESRAQALAIAEKIRVALAQPYCLRINPDDENPFSVVHRCTASIGIAFFNENEGSQLYAMKRADVAMYEAKAAGRNRLQLDALMPPVPAREAAARGSEPPRESA